MVNVLRILFFSLFFMSSVMHPMQKTITRTFAKTLQNRTVTHYSPMKTTSIECLNPLEKA